MGPALRPAALAAILFLSLAADPAGAADLPDRLVGHGGPVKSVTLSQDGTRALTASFDYSIILWDMSGVDGTVSARLAGHEAAVNDVAFVPGTDQAVSVSDDGSFVIWNLATGNLEQRITDTPVKVLDVAVSLDGRFAAAARWDGTARIFDIADATEIARADGHQGNVNAVAFSLDGRQLFTAGNDGTIREWPLDEGRIAGTSRLLYSHGWGITVLAPLPGGSLLAFGTQNGVTGLVDLPTLETVELAAKENPVLSIAASPRAGWFATGSADGRIRVFDTDTGALVEEYGDIYGPVWGLAFTPDGSQLYRVGLDDFAIRWQVEPRQRMEAIQSVYPRRFQAHDLDDPGESEFLRKCSVCHTLTPDDGNRAGPTLYRLFGRKAGTVPGYAYSRALTESDIVWTAETVSRLFDHGPDVVTPGTKMPVQRLKSVERRDALIAYLQRATAADADNLPPSERPAPQPGETIPQ
ncbi:cytochrome C [Aurantimonas sp. A2-1-M11]|uniref:cytochrome C n=1 Tax=Aurantimonas sp. A2-1-M11 TaxID=3113712 RepID=UPI002F945BCB